MATRWQTLLIASVATSVVLATGMGTAEAATVNFDQSFADPTVSPSSPVFKPTLPVGNNFACLTASNDFHTTPVGGCPDAGTPDPAGSGVLSLTPAVAAKGGSLMASNPLTTNDGLDISFNTYQWNPDPKMEPADGIGFVLAAVDPNNPTPSAVAGPAGGSLGYSASHEFDPPVEGYADGYLGVGFDVYGNFLNPQFQGSECANQPWMPASGTQSPNQITVRGPGNGLNGYCALESTANPALGLAQPAMQGDSRASSKVPVNISINPTTKPFRNAAGVTINPQSYRVSFTGIGQSAQAFSGSLPSASGLLPDGWLTSSGIPQRMVFGWTASTGKFVDNHAISDARVATLAAASKVQTRQIYAGPHVAKKGFSVTTVARGADGTVNNKAKIKTCPQARGDVSGSCAATVTYRSKVIEGAVSGKIKIKAKLPKKLRAVAVASARGWKCKITSSRALTCTTKASKFKAGKKLKPVVLRVNKRS